MKIVPKLEPPMYLKHHEAPWLLQVHEAYPGSKIYWGNIGAISYLNIGAIFDLDIGAIYYFGKLGQYWDRILGEYWDSNKKSIL